MLKYLIILITSAALALVATPIVRRFAARVGAIDMPGGRRIHAVPTPRFGGLAVYFAFLSALILASEIDPYVLTSLTGGGKDPLAMLVAATGLMTVGLIDDRRSLRPLIKLSAEVAAGVIAVASGWRIGTAFHINLGYLGALATVIWVVAVVNAVNMIDGLDGLAAGVSLIISTTLFCVSLYLRQVSSAVVLIALTGALFGFLCYNFHPARIFLGDSGSLLVGFILATSAIESSSKAATAVAIIAPLLAFGLPLAELLLTVIRRTLHAINVVHLDSQAERYRFSIRARPALFTADRDHIHHRLLALGITYRKAVVLLYTACAMLGGAAFAIVCLHGANVAFLLAAFGVVGIAAIKRLHYPELELLKSGFLLPLFHLPGANRRIVYVLFDLGFVLASYFGAYAVCGSASWWSASGRFALELPAVALAQMSCFLLSGLYRRSYRYMSIADVPAIARALALAAVAGWAVRIIAGDWRSPPLDLTIVDAYLLATFVIGSRVSFRLLDYFFKSARVGKRRVLIYGAGNGGVATLREIRSNPALGMQAIGFIDDDTGRLGHTLEGLPIFDPTIIADLIQAQNVDEVLVSSKKIPAARLEAMLRCCSGAGASLRACSITLSEIAGPFEHRTGGRPAFGSAELVSPTAEVTG